MNQSRHFRLEKQPIKLVGISATFAALYWVIESFRNVIVFDKTSMIQELFHPEYRVFWMRMLVVLMIVLFGAFVQTLRISKRHAAEKRGGTFANIHILLMGLLFSAGYWALEAIRDIVVYEAESFPDQLFRLSAFVFWMRFLPVCMLMLFSGYAQSVVNRQRETENALRLSNKKLSELDLLKSDFLNTVSHELRTPIAVMKEGVSLCMDERVGALNPMQGKLLKDTLSNIDRLNRLVTDLLDLSKIEAGKMKLHRQYFDVIKTVKKAAAAYKGQAVKKQIEFSVRSNTQSCCLYADEDKIIQIINNLLSNAFRFTMAGECIGIRIYDEPDFVRFQVRDTGIGISANDQKRLFSKFEQVERVNQSGYKGTGLGLSICRGLVEKHGGSIHVKSVPGKGSTFEFTIKKEDFPKVLIVDDEPEIINVIQSALQKEHIDTLTATDGLAALKLANEHALSLILLDLYLGKMSGYEVIGRLKQNSKTADIPIVIVSGYPFNEEKLNMAVEQKIPMIQKPFNLTELKQAVRQNLAA